MKGRRDEEEEEKEEEENEEEEKEEQEKENKEEGGFEDLFLTKFSFSDELDPPRFHPVHINPLPDDKRVCVLKI